MPNNEYRFTVQFPAGSGDSTRAGTFLHGLGHRKGAMIVQAICEYLDRHPEYERANIKIIQPAKVSQEAIIQTLLDLKRSGVLQEILDNATSHTHDHPMTLSKSTEVIESMDDIMQVDLPVRRQDDDVSADELSLLLGMLDALDAK